MCYYKLPPENPAKILTITNFQDLAYLLFMVYFVLRGINGMQIGYICTKKPFMEKQVFISIYLDTCRAKETGKFPVKLRVFTSNPETKTLPTKFEMSKADFHSIWETTKPRSEYKKTRLALQEVETKANKTAEDLNIFTFEQFEKKLYRKTAPGQICFFSMQIAIDRLKENKQIGTASNYDLASKSIKEF
ncbi:MAG: hypothetical protein IPL12_09505 [Bacteroidetes bacterium]|nr:hypothetical protein [Bacteroidota bacterium]